MIKKILDNYFLNILEKHIEYIFLHYMMDIKFDKRKDYIVLYAKDMRYNEKEYREFGVFHKENSFDYIIDFEELRKNLIKGIKEYKEENR
jgi:hypothetical protein